LPASATPVGHLVPGSCQEWQGRKGRKGRRIPGRFYLPMADGG